MSCDAALNWFTSTDALSELIDNNQTKPHITATLKPATASVLVEALFTTLWAYDPPECVRERLPAGAVGRAAAT